MAVGCKKNTSKDRAITAVNERPFHTCIHRAKKKMHVGINRSGLKVACRTMGLPGTIPCVLSSK